MPSRPVLYVLAGVNGAGKSSIGGHLLNQAGLTWYNPDSFARALNQEYGVSQEQANIDAWQEGVRRLRHAILTQQSFASKPRWVDKVLPSIYFKLVKHMMS